MSRRVYPLMAMLVLVFATLTPLANCFDTWDKGPAAPPANDTELQVAALFAGAGFVLVLPKLVRRIAVTGCGEQRTGRWLVASFVLLCRERAIPSPCASPPPAPLRI